MTCESTDACPQDLNNSGSIDYADLLEVLSAWGPADEPTQPPFVSVLVGLSGRTFAQAGEVVCAGASYLGLFDNPNGVFTQVSATGITPSHCGKMAPLHAGV